MPRRRTFGTQRLVAHLLLAAGLAAVLAGVVQAQNQLPGTQLTRDPSHDLRPAWSPDGQVIAFQSSRGGSYDILLMDADGGNQRYLVQDPADDRRPAWSPDGQWLAFDSDRSGGRDIYIVDAAGENLRQLTTGPAQETFPSWSPDGTQVAFYSYAGGVLDLYLVTLDDSLPAGEVPAPLKLTTSLADERQNQCTFACHTAAWSPDGSQLAYTGRNQTQIWVVGAAGGDERPIEGGGVYDHFPLWLPDGRILYMSERMTDRQEPVNDIWVMDVDGGNRTMLHEAVPHGGPLEFREGDETISFHSPRAGNFDIYTTVLGAEAPQEAQPQNEATAAAPTDAAPTRSVVVEHPTMPAEQPPATVNQTPDRTLGLAFLGLAVLVGGGVAVYALRRLRAG